MFFGGLCFGRLSSWSKIFQYISKIFQYISRYTCTHKFQFHWSPQSDDLDVSGCLVHNFANLSRIISSGETRKRWWQFMFALILSTCRPAILHKTSTDVSGSQLKNREFGKKMATSSYQDIPSIYRTWLSTLSILHHWSRHSAGRSPSAPEIGPPKKWPGVSTSKISTAYLR